MQLAERLRRDAARLVQTLGISLAQVEFAVGRKREPVHGVLNVAEVGVEQHVLVGLVVAVEVAHDREVGRIGDVKVATVPGEPLDAVQTAREGLGPVRHAVAVGIDQQFHRVARRIRFRVTVLRPLAHEQPAPGVEGERAGVADQRLAGEEAHGETRGRGRQLRRLRGDERGRSQDSHQSEAKVHEI